MITKKDKLYVYDAKMKLVRTMSSGELYKTLLRTATTYLLCLVVVAQFIYHYSTTMEYKNVEHRMSDILSQNELLRDSLSMKNLEESILLLSGEYVLSRDTKLPVHPDSIYVVAERAGAYYPEVIVAQAILESGCGTSNLAKSANNLLGMTKVNESGRHRTTTQLPGRSRNNFGVYHNWQLSILDRVLWERSVFKRKPRSREEYIRKMSNIYCKGNMEYVPNIHQLLNGKLKHLSK